MSAWVVVSLSTLTKNASAGVAPWKAPRRNSVVMNDADCQPQLRPERLVVGFEHRELDAA